MNIKQKSDKFRTIVNEMADLYEKKNSNYGDSFGQLFEELGPTAGLVPLWNKLHRATSLVKGNKNNFESLEDTFKDLACYAIMNLIEMEAQKDKKEKLIVKNKIQVYLAGSMFCEADRMYNAFLAEKIRERLGEDIDLYVPQENKSINDKTKCANSHDIFWGDYNRLQKCDIFIARIDGDIPPSGTSAEIGIMSQRRQDWEQNKTTEFPPMILGLCTDSRNPKRTYLDAKNELMKNEDYESQYCYFNLFTLGCIKVNGELATSVDDLVDKLEAAVKIRLSGKREVYRRLAYEDLDVCTMTNYRVYEIKYADGSSEMIKEEVKDER